MAFVIVLSYSRRVFLRFCLNAQMDSFLRGHVEAFTAFGGLARTLLYDNLKSVVLERVGDAIVFNPQFMAFAKHYRFEPRAVAVARGNQKGRVERHIDFIRKSFFAGRQFTDVDDLNVQARHWCEGRAFDRPWPQDDALTVRQAFATEQPRLLGLPDAGYDLGQRLEVTVPRSYASRVTRTARKKPKNAPRNARRSARRVPSQLQPACAAAEAHHNMLRP